MGQYLLMARHPVERLTLWKYAGLFTLHIIYVIYYVSFNHPTCRVKQPFQ